MPEHLPDSPRAILETAQNLLDDGLYFQAHEVLEAAWRAAPSAERGLWRGLTQIVVGLVHAARGNCRGAVALLRRGLTELEPHLRELCEATARGAHETRPTPRPTDLGGETPTARQPSTTGEAPRSDWGQDLDLVGVARWATAQLGLLERDCRPSADLRPPRLLRR
ncbi:DUF309 domain-containing protein [Parafrankia sp. FMc2]